MKKILLAAAMLSLAFTAGAQNKEQLLSNIQKAEVATLNEKKAANPATWIKYGDAFLNAYNELYGDMWIGISKNEALLLGGGKPLSVEQKQLDAGVFDVEHYEYRDLYFNSNGLLEMVIITKPITEENLLIQARDAYLKAIDVDVKNSKTKVINDKLVALHDNFVNDAMSYYTLGDVKTAAEYFAASIPCFDNKVVKSIDSVMVYYAGVAYSAIGENDKAKEYFEKCLEIGYDVKGDVAAALAEIAKKEGNVDLAKEYLNEAFTKYPSSQAVLVTLINLYIETNDDPNKILALIKSAQENEPSNASLVYAEGNVYKNLGDNEKAIECFQRSYEIDNNYAYGIYAVGNTYFDMAIAAQEEMNALDIRDVEGYDSLLVVFENYLLASIEPFETAFAASNDEELKVAVASALKQIYFRFRSRNPEYEAAYDKYNAYLQEHGIE